MKEVLRVGHLILLDYLSSLQLHIKSRLNKFPADPPASWSLGERGDVLLVQGWRESWHFFEIIGGRLNKLGYRIHLIRSLEHNRLRISACANQLEKYVLDHNLDQFIILGHSKGGLIAKYFLDNSPLAPRVGKIITIATPYCGSRLALITSDLSEIVVGSKTLQELNEKCLNNDRILNLYPRLDNMVIPNPNLLLKGARNIMINSVGHSQVLNSQDTLAQIERYLSR